MSRSDNSQDQTAPPEGEWMPDPVDGANLVRLHADGIFTEWVAVRNYPSLAPASRPRKLDQRASQSSAEMTSAEISAAKADGVPVTPKAETATQPVPSDSAPVKVDKAHGSRIKAAAKALRKTSGAFIAAVSKARADAQRERKQYSTRVKRAQDAAEEAKEPKKISAIGLVRRATLYEDRIKVPEGVKRLTSEVEATADQHGIRQVVQGWIFKSDQDRRENLLGIRGADWSSVLVYKQENSSVTLADIHRFADEVNFAAQDSDRIDETLTGRYRESLKWLSQHMSSLAGLEDALSTFSAISSSEVFEDMEKLEAELKSAGSDNRRFVRKAKSTLDGVRGQTARTDEQLDLEIHNLQAEIEQHRADVLELERVNHLTEKQAIQGSGSGADQAPKEGVVPPNLAENLEGPPEDRLERLKKQTKLDRLEQLARLRQMDALTQEEFESEKKALMSEPDLVDVVEKKALMSEPELVDVVLVSIGEKKVPLIKAIRAFSGSGLRETKRIVESTPILVASDLDQATAEKLRLSLEDAGGEVRFE